MPYGRELMKRCERKFENFASGVYRTFCFPFKRRRMESRTDSIILSGAYLYGNSTLEGRNYIGKNCDLNHVILGYGSYVNNYCRLTNTKIGRYTSIGTDVMSVIGRHPISECVATHPAFYSASAAMGFTYTDKNIFDEVKWIDEAEHIQIVIGNDVWIGNDVRIMEGVTIGDGAVIATGSVVTKDVEPYTVVAGIPAKSIKKRFDDDKIAKLIEFKWWDKGEDWIRENINAFANPDTFIQED